MGNTAPIKLVNLTPPHCKPGNTVSMKRGVTLGQVVSGKAIEQQWATADTIKTSATNSTYKSIIFLSQLSLIRNLHLHIAAAVFDGALTGYNVSYER